MQEQLRQVERELRVRNYSPKTAKSYLYGLKEYFAFRKQNLDILDVENIKDFLLFCEKKNKSALMEAKVREPLENLMRELL